MFILAIDQGTSSTKTLLFDTQGQVVAKGTVPLQTDYLPDGFVEQDPEGIYQNVLQSVEQCLQVFTKNGGNVLDIKTCGISNQRETFVIWNKNGQALHSAIVWQCKRSIKICERLKNQELTDTIKIKTGLIVDPYFSGTKLIWLYENNPHIKTAIDAGQAYFGTIDTWLLYKFTNGQSYLTDYTNASRTLFFNLQTLNWDAEILSTFKLSTLNLPTVVPSAAHFGTLTVLLPHLGPTQQPLSIPINAMIGDSHAAAFGEGCFETGTAKATLGTGCSLLMNIGQTPQYAQNGMITTVCWSTQNRIDYALEGAIVSCGATIEWVKNELELFKESKETAAMAQAVADNGGVCIVPAFSGLGAPHWDMTRRASIHGLTFGTTKNHIVRAVLESIPYQIKDVITAMETNAGVPLKTLMVNGGITSNEFVLSFLADLLAMPIINRDIPDVSALGAALLAGLGAGVFESIDQLTPLLQHSNTVLPNANKSAAVENGYQNWQKIIGSH
jgi:glycerol kinase